MDHTENTLRAVIKALGDTVAHAVDPADALAREQLRLVIDYIGFLQQRLDFLFVRERYELRQNLDLAHRLRGIDAELTTALQKALQQAIAAGSNSLNKIEATMPQLRQANAALAGAARRIVREAAQLPEPIRRAIEFAVVDASGPRIAFERAWYLPLGFDPAPGEVEALATYFDEQ